MADNKLNSNGNQPPEQEEISDPKQDKKIKKTKIKVKVRRSPSPQNSGKISINIIDIVVIALIVLVIVSLVLSFKFGKKLFGDDGGTNKVIEYTVIFEGVDEALSDAIKNADYVYSEDGKDYYGQVITDIEVDDYKVVGYRDGVAEMKTYPDKVNLTVTINVKADYFSGEGYRIGNKRIAVGETYKMRFPGLLAEGQCININTSAS